MTLPAPLGGTLKQLIVPDTQRAALRAEAVRLPSWDLVHRQPWDVELLLNGAFSPLAGRRSRQGDEGPSNVWPGQTPARPGANSPPP